MYFFLAKKIFFTSIRFFEFSKKWYFRHSKRTFKPVDLENNCSHENFSKLWKLWFWLFFTRIFAKKLFKYFLTYKNKEINVKSFFQNLAPFEICFFFVDLDSLKSVIKYDDWIKMAGSLIWKLWNFEEPRAQSGRFNTRRAFTFTFSANNLRPVKRSPRVETPGLRSRLREALQNSITFEPMIQPFWFNRHIL